MAFRNVVLPWLGGGLLVLGYAALSRLRTSRVQGARVAEHESEPLPAQASSRSADLGALFLGRATEALSSFPFGPDWPHASTAMRKF